MIRTPRLLGLVLALGVSGALVGCGDGGGGSAAPPPPAAPAAGGGGGAAPAPAGGGSAYDPAKATATLTVTALLSGEAPKMRPIKFDADPKCGEAHKTEVLDESVAAADGKLANVIVYVSRGAEKWSYKTPGDAVVLDQVGCMYTPHVFTCMTNQAITIKNSDPVMHNVHAMPKKNDEFNRSQIAGAKDLSEKFAKEEVGVRIKCDVHGWMASYAGVFSHPFHAVSGADGKASIKLPAGEYEITVWHEKLAAPVAQKVTVAEGEAKALEFTFAAK